MGDTEEIETLVHHQHESTVVVINDEDKDEPVGASAYVRGITPFFAGMILFFAFTAWCFEIVYGMSRLKRFKTSPFFIGIGHNKVLRVLCAAFLGTSVCAKMLVIVTNISNIC